MSISIRSTLRVFHVFVAVSLPRVLALGINCQGSAVCPLATFENTATVEILTALRNNLYNSNLPATTSWGEHEHITCVGNKIAISIGPKLFNLGGSIPAGAVCAFPENLPSGRKLTLAQVRTLADALVDHKCKTCGGVPITWPTNSDVSGGELKFDFVSDDTCSGNCISAGRNDGSNNNPSVVTIGTTPQAVSTSQQPSTVVSTVRSSIITTSGRS